MNDPKDITMITIDGSARQFSEANTELTDLAISLTRTINEIKANFLPKIKRLSVKVAGRRSELDALIQRAPHLFEKPRTITLHGIKVGFQKGKGGIIYGDPEAVVRLIERHFPDQLDLLLHIKKSPNKQGLAQLSVADLKRVGCEIQDSGDHVVIKPVDSDVEKLVAAFLRELEDDPPQN